MSIFTSLQYPKIFQGQKLSLLETLPPGQRNKPYREPILQTKTLCLEILRFVTGWPLYLGILIAFTGKSLDNCCLSQMAEMANLIYCDCLAVFTFVVLRYFTHIFITERPLCWVKTDLNFCEFCSVITRIAHGAR